jgi:hypothetical protein
MLCELLSWNSLGGGIGGWIAVGVANVFLTPVLLVYWAIVIYVAPCFRSLLETCCCKILSGLCGDACVFTDAAFPANDTSAGKAGVKWARISEIKLKGKGGETKLSRLFSNIEPGDIAQGQLGDCWLLAALATLAERQHLIMNCFLTTHYNPRGKYALKLYDQKASQFKTFEIDDKIPVDSNNCPLYSNATTNESWVLLLEKGFAKMRGGYKALEGGLPLDAMTTITGFNGERFIIDKKDDKIWHKMRAMHSANCLMSCGSKGEDRTREEGREAVKGSIVGGHAYSVLGLYEPMLSTEKVRLLKLRNPWGNFEWKGKVRGRERHTDASSLQFPPDAPFFSPHPDTQTTYSGATVTRLGRSIPEWLWRLAAPPRQTTGSSTLSGTIFAYSLTSLMS